MKKITIEKITYFANVEYDEDFNAKIIYKKYGKTYLAAFFVCFFNRRIYIPKQPKHHKVLVGLQQALEIHYFK